ncbi:MAG: pyridoxamine 5'-phosphate oxidase family protein [Kouleothrix sp.]|jgi:nitroimidazol reductase NimA-like FMN-containing flavoprotein (pyridoxamine 5'-phosphate oxidase superfamily)|nr:pyridoxamine 5'-phosphate oxidase family protein [Kouleothrix sp.]
MHEIAFAPAHELAQAIRARRMSSTALVEHYLSRTARLSTETHMKSYPQMPPFTHDELTAFLEEAPIARLSSLNPDGTIHMAACYFRYENGAILLGTQDMTHKVQNIKHSPKVTLLIDNQAPPWKGVLIYGEAELDYDDVVAKRVAIFERYMPAENARRLAAGLANTYTPVIIRITPTRISSYDYSKQGFIQASLAAMP